MHICLLLGFVLMILYCLFKNHFSSLTVSRKGKKMVKKFRSPKGYFIFALFALGLALRSWTIILTLVFTLFLFWRFPLSRQSKKRSKLTKLEEDAIISQWEPEPLVPEYPNELMTIKPRAIQGKMLKYIDLDGKHQLNMATNDFLSFVGNQRIEEVAQKTIAKYGVGACGPRNFYGTVDVHLDLERQLAEFLECEETILYSYGFATISSAIPAYSKQGDIIFVDKGVNFAIQKGLQASRSKIVWFEHNNVDDLEKLLMVQDILDKKNPKKAKTIRRCIIVEGLYANSSSICPLPKLIDLKWKYKVRIFVDESLSFGVLGQHGKGVTEHFGVDIIDVDLIAASLEYAMATTGGFCAGRSYVIGHQRLSGLGYCFSASLPPLLTTAASEALAIIQERPEIIEQLRTNCIFLHQLIQAAIRDTGFNLIGVDIAPVKHIGYVHDDIEVVDGKLDSLVSEMNENGIFVTRARYLLDKEAFPPKPSMKIICRTDLTSEEIEDIGKKLLKIIQKLESINYSILI